MFYYLSQLTIVSLANVHSRVASTLDPFTISTFNVWTFFLSSHLCFIILIPTIIPHKYLALFSFHPTIFLQQILTFTYVHLHIFLLFNNINNINASKRVVSVLYLHNCNTFHKKLKHVSACQVNKINEKNLIQRAS